MYTDKIVYEKPPLFNGQVLTLNPSDSCDPENFQDSHLLRRANNIFHHKFYENPCPPEPLKTIKYFVPQKETYVLRLLIKAPGTEVKLPVEIDWVAPFVSDCLFYEKLFPNYQNRFWYLTVRNGPSESCGKEAETFHVDGFQGAKLPRHIPQQSIIWTDKYPTQWSIQPYFLRALDKHKHNIHFAFNKLAHKDFIFTGIENTLYMFDPYCVHRKDSNAVGFRTVLRMTISPVLVEDDTNTANPALVVRKFHNKDPRNHLTECDEEVFAQSLNLAKLKRG